MDTILGVLQVVLCVVLIFLILMHSGKDAGLSGAFGVGTGAGPFGGGSLVERNLNRWTIGFAIAFVDQHDPPDQDLLSAPAPRPQRGSEPVADLVDEPEQVEWAERLGQEQIGAGLLGAGLDPVVVGGGEHHDRRRGRSLLGAQRAAGLDPVEARHVDVEEHERGPLRRGDLERVDPVLRPRAARRRRRPRGSW